MRKLIALLIALLPLQAPAQETASAQTERDRSYLTGLIEDNLSGAGRQVRLEGFEGALSSRASFTTLSISDANGTWLTLRNGSMAWDRKALLLGQISVQELSAEEIDLPRLPLPAETEDVTPEVKPFALPSLPVSIEIGSIRAEKAYLGAPVLGQNVVVALQGSLRLAKGEGTAAMTISRIDGQKAQIALNASYANETRQALIDLLVTEGKEGIVSGLLNLPGRPSLTLSASGAGPIDDFSADILLGTDGAARLSGNVTLSKVPSSQPGSFENRFTLALSGDVSPLLPAQYRSFWGPEASLNAQGRRTPSGSLSLSKLDLRGQSVLLSGAVDLLPSGMPERFDLRAKISQPGNQTILLPLAGPPTTLHNASLRLSYDRTRGDGWVLAGHVDALSRQGITIETLGLNGSGRIGTPAAGVPTVGGALQFAASGISLPETGLQAAIGPAISGKARFFWQKGKPLRLPDIQVSLQDAFVSARLSLKKPAEGGEVSGRILAEHRNLQSLSGLAGRTLSGQAKAEIEGHYTLLTGAFDGTATIDGTGLRMGQPQADAFMAGLARISASARRDESGLTVRNFSAHTEAISLDAEGSLSKNHNALSAHLALPDLARLGAGHSGSVQADLMLSGAMGSRQIRLSGKAQNLATPSPELTRILAKQSLFSANLHETDGALRLHSAEFSTPEFTAKARANSDARQSFDISMLLENTALIAPGFSGPLAVQGKLSDAGARYGLDLRAKGPGGTEAAVSGTIQADLSASDLKISGRTETALANAFISPQSVQGPLAFDLRLRGKPALTALSGDISAAKLAVSLPALGQKLEDIGLRVAISSGQARLDMQARLANGGLVTLAGPVRLASPYQGELVLALDRARLKDPELYDTRVSGQLRILGPLANGPKVTGALALDNTELRIPSGSIAAVAAIPDIRHIGEPAAVRQTRLDAGLIEIGKPPESPSQNAIALDVSITAPQQIFVRGRGLDAELGGALRLTGTSANIQPIGEFRLIRGRLDVLGKRFTLTEGQIALEGAMEPWILFGATTEQDEIAIKIAIEGNASEPTLKITSSPDLPEEEVLSRLLFGRSLDTLSPLQAAQLASAVASLAGKGGEGIVSRLRQGFGLDDLDVGVDESGNATVRAGKYLAENIYTDVAVDGAGKAEITLNLDVTPQLTARGTLGSTGESSLGLFFEKDY